MNSFTAIVSVIAIMIAGKQLGHFAALLHSEGPFETSIDPAASGFKDEPPICMNFDRSPVNRGH